MKILSSLSWPIRCIALFCIVCGRHGEVTAGPPSTQDVPNIVLINIDDMGYADISPFGNTRLQTPHLQKLADAGRRFTSFYAAPTCTMSRARLMTGCYNPRVSLNAVLFPEATIGLNPSERTIAEVTKEQDYATACIGKWHLGDHPKFLPTRQGFDTYFGLPYSNDMHAGRKFKGDFCPPLPLMQGERIIETEPDQAFLTKRYTEASIEFMRQQRDRPFFLYLAHTMVHFPLAASPPFKGESAGGLIGDTIEEIDWSVGQILAALDDLHLADKTLVIFTSDNGPAKRDAPPFRGAKGSNWEGGVRVPTIMRWPNKIPAGTTCDQIAGMIDILPTVAAIIDVPLDPDRKIDGQDILPLMTEQAPGPVRNLELYFSGGNPHPAGIRRGKWKLMTQYPRRTKSVPGGGPWLFDLETDIGETTNVAASHPDIVQSLSEAKQLYDAELTTHARPAGRVAAKARGSQESP